MRNRKVVIIGGWVARLIAAAILGMSLFYKVIGDEASIYVFEQMGVEPWGRYGTAIAELVAAMMLLIPALGWAGGLLGAVVMLGAIGSHVTKLGIVVQDDGGVMFAMACIVLICCLFVAYVQRAKIPVIGARAKRG